MNIKPYFHNAKYYETDQMSIIHHSNYIRWFEEARIDCLEQMGIPYDEMEARGVIIPVIGVSAEYKSMTRFKDTVEIRLKLLAYNGVRFSMGYEVRDAETGQLRCTGSSHHCFIDRNDRPIILKKAAPDYHQRFMAFLEHSKENL
ncbi:MAG: acyl-CoA thioesterase [Oscillospiraceae bacterium]|nr:acyl-CoA thioesterase [Oscillospiraceae bacterium]